MRISELLAFTLKEQTGALPNPQPSVSELVEALGPRSFGFVLVLFGLPNLLPVPGLPMVCGLIIGVVAIQMLQGRESLALPRWIGNRRVKREDLQKVVERAQPTLRRLEAVMRPRLQHLTEMRAQRLIGLALLLLAIALMAPIPFFGGIPPGIPVILFGLALVERDGIFVIFGAFGTAVALVITALLTYAILRSVTFLFAMECGQAALA